MFEESALKGMTLHEAAEYFAKVKMRGRLPT